MSDDVTRDPGEIAKRAVELAARADELAREAADAATSDEQLAQLDAELAELEAEQARLDEGLGLDDEDRVAAGPQHDRATAPSGSVFDWTTSFAGSMDQLGERIADTVTRAVDSALGKTSFDDLTERHEPVDGPVPVHVSNPGGNVRVEVGTGDQVVVRARRRRSNDPTRPPVEVKVEKVDGRVEVSVVGGRRWFGNQGAALDVRVPVGSPIDVSTGGGSVLVSGTGAPVSARTGGGSITVDDAGDVSALTGGGGVALTQVDGSVQVKTGGGSIRVSGRLRGDSSLTTGGGGIVVELDPASELEVVATAQGIHSEIAGLSGGRGQVVGSIGSGRDGRLSAHTGGGSIALRCRVGAETDAAAG